MGIEEALKRQRLQQQALDDEDEEEPELMDEDEIDEPPTKKQKTDKGSKATKNVQKAESKKKRKSPQQKAKKSPQQKPVETSLDDKKEEKDEKKSTKASKKMLSMGKGLKYRDMKIGKGKTVSNGDKLSVFYVGQTDDKKVFDKCISGKGFEFEFGKGEVIKGWDLGLKGMKKVSWQCLGVLFQSLRVSGHLVAISESFI